MATYINDFFVVICAVQFMQLVIQLVISPPCKLKIMALLSIQETNKPETWKGLKVISSDSRQGYKIFQCSGFIIIFRDTADLMFGCQTYCA